MRTFEIEQSRKKVPGYDINMNHLLTLPDLIKVCGKYIYYRTVHKPGVSKPEKVPVNASGDLIDYTISGNWISFPELPADVPPAVDGVGLVPHGPLVAVDIDADCPIPEEIIRDLNSWTERSVSGNGYHVVCTMSRSFPNSRVRSSHTVPGVEIFRPNGRHWIALTNNRVPGTPNEVNNATDALLRLYRRMFPSSVRKIANPPDTSKSPISVQTARSRVRRHAEKFEDFRRIFIERDFTGFEDASNDGYNRSSVDHKACCTLAFLCDKDAALIDLMYRESALYDDRHHKWNRDSYRIPTIEAAIAATTKTYSQYIAEKRERSSPIFRDRIPLHVKVQRALKKREI